MMENTTTVRVTRSAVAAFLMSVLMPSLGLLYVRRPIEGIVCSLISLICLVLAQLASPPSFPVIVFFLILYALPWLYGVLVATWRARRGLSPEEAQRDMGLWIVCWLIVTLPLSAIEAIDSVPYKTYSMQSGSMEPIIRRGERVLVHMHGPTVSLRLGEVGVFTKGDIDLIRKVSGLPGDVMSYEDNTLLRNGQAVGRFANNPLPAQESAMIVPQDSFLLTVEDVNGEASLLHKNALRGKVLYIAWSKDLNRLGLRPSSVVFDAGDMALIRKMHVLWARIEAGGPMVEPLDIFGKADARETAARLTGLPRQQAVAKLRRVCVLLPKFITNARLAPGEYTIPEEFREPFDDPIYGMDEQGKFTLTARHLKLLQLGIIWNNRPDDGDEDVWPVQGLTFKRPYGDFSYYMYEMADILGEPYTKNPATGMYIEDAAKDAAMKKLHHELLSTLQVLLLYGEMPNMP
jgi:signal peptidase I